MRRIVIAIASTITGLVLLFSWPTSLNRTVTATGTSGTDGTGSGTTESGTTDSGTTDSGTTDSGTTDSGTTGSDGTSGDSSSTGSSGSSAGDTTQSSGSQTYTGAAAQTRFGDVTVQITVTDGRLTDAQAIEYPNNNRHDQQINAYAIPILNSEAVAAGSADIQTVSGATFTSQGYVASLQDALDQAGL